MNPLEISVALMVTFAPIVVYWLYRAWLSDRESMMRFELMLASDPRLRRKLP